MFPRVVSDTATFLLAQGASRLGDGVIERLFGRPQVLRVIVEAMARGYRPDVMPQFRGTIVYTLTRPNENGEPLGFALTVDGSGARPVDPRAVEGVAAAEVSLPMADFVRIAAGAVDPAEPLLAGRASIAGDLGLASRLPEMFGAPALR